MNNHHFSIKHHPKKNPTFSRFTKAKTGNKGPNEWVTATRDEQRWHTKICARANLTIVQIWQSKGSDSTIRQWPIFSSRNSSNFNHFFIILSKVEHRNFEKAGNEKRSSFRVLVKLEMNEDKNENRTENETL